MTNQIWASMPCRQSSHPICRHKSTQVVAQMVKRPKECLHQQKERRSTNLEPLKTPKWLHSGRAYHDSWCIIQHSSETGSSPSFQYEWKEAEHLQAYLYQRRHFSPSVVLCDGVLESEAKIVPQNLAGCKPRHEIRKVLFRNFTNFMKSMISNAMVQCEPHIYASEDHASLLCA